MDARSIVALASARKGQLRSMTLAVDSQHHSEYPVFAIVVEIQQENGIIRIEKSVSIFFDTLIKIRLISRVSSPRKHCCSNLQKILQSLSRQLSSRGYPKSLFHGLLLFLFSPLVRKSHIQCLVHSPNMRLAVVPNCWIVYIRSVAIINPTPHLHPPSQTKTPLPSKTQENPQTRLSTDQIVSFPYEPALNLSTSY